MRCHLDKVVATPSWNDLFPVARVQHLAPIHGDHVPILLGAFKEPPAKKEVWRRRFHFESFWT